MPDNRTSHGPSHHAPREDSGLAGRTVSPETPPELATRLISQRYCGYGALVGVNPSRDTMVIIPMTCKSWECPRCGPIRRTKLTNRLMQGNPNKEITLTLRADPTRTTRELATMLKAAWLKLVKRTRKTYGEMEYALIWELQRNGTPHAHVLVRSAYIPQRWLSQQWRTLTGSSNVFIRKITNRSAHAFHASKYVGKCVGQTAAAIAPLHIVQFSQHYAQPDLLPSHESRFASFVWTRTAADPQALFDRVRNASRYLSASVEKSGLIVIDLDPSPQAPEDLRRQRDLIMYPESDALELHDLPPPRPYGRRP